MKHLGDFVPGVVVRDHFTTYSPSTGAPSTLGGGSGPNVVVYKDGGTSQSSAGVTLTLDFDGVAGLNLLAIDTSADGSFYATGGHFSAVILNGTVDGVSVVGACVFSFDLEKGTVADVKVTTDKLETMIQAQTGVPSGYRFTAEALSNVLAETGEIQLTLAAISDQATAIEADTQDIQSRLPAALTGGRMDASVGAMAANTFTASALAADAVTEIQSGLATSAALATTDGKVDAIKAKTDNLPTDPADQSLVIAATTAIYDRIGAPAGVSVSADIAAVKADTAAGATAAALTTVGNNVTAVKAKTDSLTFTVAGQVDSNVQYVNDTAVGGNGQPGTEWGPA